MKASDGQQDEVGEKPSGQELLKGRQRLLEWFVSDVFAGNIFLLPQKILLQFAKPSMSEKILRWAFGSKETKEFAEQKGALTFLEKPVNISVLEDYIEVNIVNKGFSGNISHINLYDFIKMITFTNAQKLISITRPVTKKTGYIYFDKGNVIHAEFENLTGEDAFLKIMGIKNGIFTDLAWTEPSKTTINQPADNLLLKSAKLNDEGSSDISLKHSKGKILVVDDDHMTLMILEKHLSKQGFSITTAESAIVGAEILF